MTLFADSPYSAHHETYFEPAATHGPRFEVMPTNYTVGPGETATLKCAIDNLGGKKVLWVCYG